MPVVVAEPNKRAAAAATICSSSYCIQLQLHQQQRSFNGSRSRRQRDDLSGSSKRSRGKVVCDIIFWWVFRTWVFVNEDEDEDVEIGF